MKIVCRDGNNNEFRKCATSEIYYRDYSTDICDDDPLFYQLCGKNNIMDITAIGNIALCGEYICQRETYTVLSSTSRQFRCNGKYDCRNTEIDEERCPTVENKVEMTSNPDVRIDELLICDGYCDDPRAICEDESYCNGFLYGMYHNREGIYAEYIPPYLMCDHNSSKDCNLRKFEVAGGNCYVKSYAHNDQGRQKQIIRIKDNMRCFSLNLVPGINIITNQVCENFMDQTNCTDPSRAEILCSIKGFPSTVSIFMTCKGHTQLCDDNLENNCLWTSQTCYIHKHKVCNYIKDCSDNNDENSNLCTRLTSKNCTRRGLNTGPLPFPLAWIKDGITDCVDGSDERDEWSVCGSGVTERSVQSEKIGSCRDVFLCPYGTPSFVEYDQLCDGVESCGYENRVCTVSRSFADLRTTVPVFHPGHMKMLLTCLDGLQDLVKYDSTICVKSNFQFPSHKILGVSGSMNRITFPLLRTSCDHIFGDAYVFASCNGICLDSECPLNTTLTYHSCPHQFPQRRVGTYAYDYHTQKPYLTFVTRTKGSYHNDYFACNNTKMCIPYTKVCDLVNDCGDATDEKKCTNHFKCQSELYYIPKSQKCDGTFHCMDFSDECNDQCSKEILDGHLVKFMSWTIGVSAVLCNTFSIGRRIKNLTKCKNIRSLNNTMFILLICIGDLLVGLYILGVAIADAYFSDAYCFLEREWLMSAKCSALGVLSTTGTQISIISMTILSLIRVFAIKHSLIDSKPPNKYNILILLARCCLVIVGSFALSLIPITDEFEDFFVNGMHYDPEIKLFIGFPDKNKHLDILAAYHGRIRKQSMSWKLINNMVGEMFSQQYGLFERHRKKLNFYGNDGVCMFKFFVKFSDPQNYFVWGVLALDKTFFAIIAISYVIITTVSKRSTDNLGDRFKKRHRKTQRKITLIISTNFFCWVPFIFVCILHTTNILDATEWYSIFSVIILPINSVINPFLYDELLSGKLSAVFFFLKSIYHNKNTAVTREILALDVLGIRHSNPVVIPLPIQKGIQDFTREKQRLPSTDSRWDDEKPRPSTESEISPQQFFKVCLIFYILPYRKGLIKVELNNNFCKGGRQKFEMIASTPLRGGGSGLSISNTRFRPMGWG